MNRNFNDWFSKFKSSISNYSYYVNFDKIYEQADKYKVELNILNSLIGSKNIEEDFENIIVKYPETLVINVTCTSNKGTCNGITNGAFPESNDILLYNDIEVGEKQEYTLTMKYIDNGLNQSADMNKILSAKINIIDAKNTIDLTGEVASYTLGDYVQINSEPKKSRIVKNKDGKYTYKLVGVKPDEHELGIYNDGNEEILLVGLDSNLSGRQDVKKAYEYFSTEGYNSNIYTISLVHEPDSVSEMMQYKNDLILAGHSINGSINIPGIKQLLLPDGAHEFYNPYYKIDNTNIYISENAFRGCKNLNTVNFEGSISGLERYAFARKLISILMKSFGVKVNFEGKDKINFDELDLIYIGSGTEENRNIVIKILCVNKS